MGILQKNPFTHDVGQQLYNFGHNKTILIVGLGNVGKKYVHTRHNVGFMCVDYFAHSNEFPDWMEKRDLRAYLTKKTMGNTEVILIKPSTMMNLSGEAVQAVAHFYKIPIQQITAIHDELDIQFGQIRTRVGGGTAGHNGIKNIVKHLDQDFGRVRVGVDSSERPQQMDSADYVLSDFTKTEKEQLPHLVKEVASILTETIYGDRLATDTRNFLM